ncbi:hypothetical protein DEO72_LG3g292 [Vigna unguiculata]|uniref:Uncharacterized protein n=1 Tax=Vigna unguiculata TaxID=3917 RepID=A0A4D6LB21_VIGUN|nr:hypothetical protein DEO72_LG3g292 [Vigna unguiculata]
MHLKPLSPENVSSFIISRVASDLCLNSFKIASVVQSLKEPESARVSTSPTMTFASTTPSWMGKQNQNLLTKII